MSKITVTTLAGHTSGADANKVKVESGDTLEVTSNATVGGTLGVTGASTLTGATTATGGITIPASTTVGLNFGSGTDLAQLAMQSAVNDRIALRTTHTSTGDNNPFIIYQPSSAGVQNDALVVNTGGQVTMSKQPFVRLRLTSHVNSGASNVSYPGNQVTGFQVNENVGSYWNSSNNNFTCPVAGVYQVSIFFIKYPSGGACHVDLHKNGSMVDEIRWRAPEAGSHYYQAGGTASLTCAANDVLDWHYHGTAGIHNGNGSWQIKLTH